MKTFALITGASSGIGKACAQRLASLGHNLILVARRLDRLDEMANQINRDFNVQVITKKADFMNLSDIEALFNSIADLPIDVLVNNAGFALGKSSIEEYDWNDFDQMIGVNVKGFTRVAQLAIPHLKTTHGHIINVSSIAGIEAYEGGSVYCGTKAYVKMLSKSMRIDLAGTGVRVTDIAPGAVDTEFSLVRFKGDQQKAEAVYHGFVPLSASDIADVIEFSLNRPPHVNIEYILITPTAQASATRISRNQK